MAKFTYQAIDEIGKTVSGVIEADSPAAVSNILADRGFIPSRITRRGEVSGPSAWDSIRGMLTKVKAADLILFTKQFRTMTKAGVPMLALLEVLEEQTENQSLKRIAGLMHQDIEEGTSLYDAFRKHPRVFSPLYCSMLQAGEASGALPEVLDRLTYIIEHENKIRSDVKSALQYPMIVIFFLAIAFFVLLTFVIPKFVPIFNKANIALPIPTKISILLYQFLSNYWYVILAGVAAVALILAYYLKTEQGRYVRDTVYMKLPIIGPLFIKAAMSRFASIFAILQSSGVAVLESLRILSGTIGNSAISREFELIGEKLEEGRGISDPLKSARYFTPIVVNMVAIGEESGNLAEMLSDISEHYDSELEYAMTKLSEAIGPILTVGLAGVVGFFALSIFLPMWDLTKMARGF
jgi:type II secretory pathway component PulF